MARSNFFWERGDSKNPQGKVVIYSCLKNSQNVVSVFASIEANDFKNVEVALKSCGTIDDIVIHSEPEDKVPERTHFYATLLEEGPREHISYIEADIISSGTHKRGKAVTMIERAMKKYMAIYDRQQQGKGKKADSGQQDMAEVDMSKVEWDDFLRNPKKYDGPPKIPQVLAEDTRPYIENVFVNTMIEALAYRDMHDFERSAATFLGFCMRKPYLRLAEDMVERLRHKDKAMNYAAINLYLDEMQAVAVEWLEKAAEIKDKRIELTR